MPIRKVPENLFIRFEAIWNINKNLGTLWYSAQLRTLDTRLDDLSYSNPDVLWQFKQHALYWDNNMKNMMIKHEACKESWGNLQGWEIQTWKGQSDGIKEKKYIWEGYLSSKNPDYNEYRQMRN